MAGLATDFAWGESFLPDIRRHLAELLFAKASLEVDRNEATDLMVLEVVGGQRIACRMRRSQYLQRFPHDVAIRLSRPSGARTEFAKIFEDGWADWYFYGFAHPSRELVGAYRIVDLHAFRAAWSTQQLQYSDIPSPDGTGSFRAFDTRELPPGVVVKRWIMPGAKRERRGIVLPCS